MHGSRVAERKFHTKEKLLVKVMPGDSWTCTKRKYGRPLLLSSLDQMLQRLLLFPQKTGGLVSSAVAISATKALIARNPQYNLSHIDLDSSHWAQSLFRIMGFKKRMWTTGKVEIPEGARKEAELLYLHNIVTIVEKYETPHSVITNLDQTPLKYIPAMSHTMAKQYSKSVSIAGSSNKRSITGTFTTTFNGHFSSMQLIYGGKQRKASLSLSFPMVSR